MLGLRGGNLVLLIEKVQRRIKRSFMESGMLRKVSGAKAEVRPFYRESEDED